MGNLKNEFSNLYILMGLTAVLYLECRKHNCETKKLNDYKISYATSKACSSLHAPVDNLFDPSPTLYYQIEICDCERDLFQVKIGYTSILEVFKPGHQIEYNASDSIDMTYFAFARAVMCPESPSMMKCMSDCDGYYDTHFIRKLLEELRYINSSNGIKCKELKNYYEFLENNKEMIELHDCLICHC